MYFFNVIDFLCIFAFSPQIIIMKKALFILLVLIVVPFLSFGQSDTYKIETLSPPEKPIFAFPASNLFSRIEKDFIKLSVAEPLADMGEHAVIGGFLRAYQDHRPITISPDIIWLLISQGFAQHVNNNAEALRSKFVNFQGQKELIVKKEVGEEGLSEFPWESIFPEFTTQIGTHVGAELISALSADFTTTTPTSRIASQITVMESMKKYFKYVVIMIGCGIPEVTIEGSLADWKKIMVKLDYLATYDLEWWTSELKPVIQEIINAKSGKFNKKFWMNMVKFHSKESYGVSGIDGWLLKFYPYLKNKKRSDFKKIPTINELPPEIVRVPFIFVDNLDPQHPVEYNMEFWAGFMGVTEDVKTFNVKPEIGWAINRPKASSGEEDIETKILTRNGMIQIDTIKKQIPVDPSKLKVPQTDISDKFSK